jgi:hypothetical protein
MATYFFLAFLTFFLAAFFLAAFFGAAFLAAFFFLATAIPPSKGSWRVVLIRLTQRRTEINSLAAYRKPTTVLAMNLSRHVVRWIVAERILPEFFGTLFL